MINSSRWIPNEVAEYMNSHPAFTDSQGCIINSDFFDEYIREFTDVHKGTVPIADKYRKAIWEQVEFTMEDAKEFLEWLDPKWMDYKHLDKSEFFRGPDLTLANDGIEFMDI